MDLTNCQMKGSFNTVSNSKIKFEGSFNMILNNSIRIESDSEKGETVISELKLNGRSVEIFRINAPLEEFEKFGKENTYFNAVNRSKKIKVSIDNHSIFILDQEGKSFLPEAVKDQLKDETLPISSRGEYNLETKEWLHAVYKKENSSDNTSLTHSLYFQERIESPYAACVTFQNDLEKNRFSFKIENPIKTIEIRTALNSVMLESGEEITNKEGVQTKRSLTYEEIIEAYSKMPKPVLAQSAHLTPACIGFKNPNRIKKTPLRPQKSASFEPKEEKPIKNEAAVALTQPASADSIPMPEKDLSPKSPKPQIRNNLMFFEILASIKQMFALKITNAKSKQQMPKQNNRDR